MTILKPQVVVMVAQMNCSPRGSTVHWRLTRPKMDKTMRKIWEADSQWPKVDRATTKCHLNPNIAASSNLVSLMTSQSCSEWVSGGTREACQDGISSTEFAWQCFTRSPTSRFGSSTQLSWSLHGWYIWRIKACFFLWSTCCLRWLSR